jgi:hypothetical protein
VAIEVSGEAPSLKPIRETLFVVSIYRVYFVLTTQPPWGPKAIELYLWQLRN